MNRLSLAEGIYLFRIVTSDHHFTARISAQSVNLQLWTCTLVSGNLFKQGSSETQDGETLIVSASRIIYGSDKQTKSSPQFYSWSPVPESRG